MSVEEVHDDHGSDGCGGLNDERVEAEDKRRQRIATFVSRDVVFDELCEQYVEERGSGMHGDAIKMHLTMRKPCSLIPIDNHEEHYNVGTPGKRVQSGGEHRDQKAEHHYSIDAVAHQQLLVGDDQNLNLALIACDLLAECEYLRYEGANCEERTQLPGSFGEHPLRNEQVGRNGREVQVCNRSKVLSVWNTASSRIIPA